MPPLESKARPDLWVAGLGLVCAAGSSLDASLQTLRSGETAIRELTLFPAPSKGPWLGQADGFGERLEDSASRCESLGVAATRQAIESLSAEERSRTAFIFGTNLEDARRHHVELATSIAQSCGLGGPVSSVSVACASGAAAIAAAARLLSSGSCDAAVVLGADVITPRVQEGFAMLGLLSEEPCEPLSERMGTTLGEGAGALLLRRGKAPPRSLHLLGWGTSNDAYDLTAPHGRGEGVRRALDRALQVSAISSGSIGCLKLHATGTIANDAAEWRGLQSLFDAPPNIAAPKGFLGHTQGAAGAAEAALVLGGHAAGRIPGAVVENESRPRVPARQTHFAPNPARPNVALLNSGFGGSNAALIFGPQTGPTVDSSRPVFLRAASLLGPGVRYAGALSQLPTRSATGPRQEIDGRKAVPGADLRLEDRSTQGLVTTVSDLMRHTRVRPSGTGLSVGQYRVSRSQLASVQTRRAAAPAQTFARSFLGFPASLSCIHLGLDGPFCVHTAGVGAGLEALAHALFAVEQGDAAQIIAGSVDEGKSPQDFDGACSTLLTTDGSVRIRARFGAPGEAQRLERELAAELHGSAFDASVTADADRSPVPPLLDLLELAGRVEAGEIRSAAFSFDAPGLFALVFGLFVPALEAQ